MLKPSRTPDGFKNLLAYKKAEEIQKECSRLTALFPFSKTLVSLADQMSRSARSGKQNIVEGWKRNSTKEYYEFLGFSIGANKELEEDCNDICSGIYPELTGIRGIMGERGIKGYPSTSPISSALTPSAPLPPYASATSLTPLRSSAPLAPFLPLFPFDIEKLKFYPLDRSLPPVVQLKLRCKELDFLFHKLQLSLIDKMENEKTLTISDKQARIEMEKRKQEKFARDILAQNGLQSLL